MTKIHLQRIWARAQVDKIGVGNSQSNGYPRRVYPSTEREGYAILGMPTEKSRSQEMALSSNRLLDDVWCRCFTDRHQVQHRSLQCHSVKGTVYDEVVFFLASYALIARTAFATFILHSVRHNQTDVYEEAV